MWSQSTACSINATDLWHESMYKPLPVVPTEVSHCVHRDSDSSTFKQDKLHSVISYAVTASTKNTI